ncbi:hypothetical protein DFJ73DRAFT_797307 [Zopfochytrium polystomum]|nr:hypothetical protein DFJ73DRAFT_797307 [Zopfochytrium polystomum]
MIAFRSLLTAAVAPAVRCVAPARAFSRTPAAHDVKTLFVGNLAWTVRSDDLGTLFSEFGEVKSSRVMSDRETGRSRGFGFVEMEEVAANVAAEKLNGFSFKGRDLRVNVSEPRPQDGRGGAPRFGGRDRRDF